jgi:predicted acetyltransferase
MLTLALVYCRDEIGVDDVLVTCPDTNVASRKVIETNGGVLENVVDGERRYWCRRRGDDAT